MKEFPSEKFTITIQGNSYETSITMGKIRDFNVNKIVFSRGYYESLKDVLTLNTIDVTSAIYSFFPEAEKDFKIKDPFDLKPKETMELFKSFEPFFKWYKEWYMILNEVEREEEKEDVELPE